MRAINCDYYSNRKKKCIAPQELGNPKEDPIICIIPEDPDVCPVIRYFLDNVSEKSNGTKTLYQWLRIHGY